MGGAKPQQPDTSYLDEQRADREAEKEKVERENRARRRNIRGRTGGFRSLLFNDERGVTGNGGGGAQTLGGA